STIGLAYFTPRISVDMSTLLTSIGAQRDLVVDARGHVAEMRGRNVLAADRLEIEDVDRLLGRFDKVVRAHGRPHQRIGKLAAGRKPFAGEGVKSSGGKQRTPGQELQKLAPAGGVSGERRHGEPSLKSHGPRPTLSAGVGAAPGPSYWCARCVSTCQIALTYDS